MLYYTVLCYVLLYYISLYCIILCAARYVVGVGWDRCINIYTDEPNDTGLHQLVDPQERWEDDKVSILFSFMCIIQHLYYII